jgi:hypothetical protein
VSFTRFTPSPQGDSIQFEGEIRGPSVSLNFRDFRQLIINLGNHPFFGDVTINSVERRDTWLVFSLTVSVPQPQP